MTDKELLELAAKACSQEYWITRLGPRKSITEHLHYKGCNGETKIWNPLTDDGEAFRLVVILELLVHVETCYYVHAIKDSITATEHIGNDGKGCIFAATRRAIVRTAAEIGKRMGGKL